MPEEGNGITDNALSVDMDLFATPEFITEEMNSGVFFCTDSLIYKPKYDQYNHDDKESHTRIEHDGTDKSYKQPVTKLFSFDEFSSIFCWEIDA